jgi:uncharacterized membrane protein affecting hemolysin expression
MLLQQNTKHPVASSSSNRGHLRIAFDTMLLVYSNQLMHLGAKPAMVCEQLCCCCA